jgi:hypothetical protein
MVADDADGKGKEKYMEIALQSSRSVSRPVG